MMMHAVKTGCIVLLALLCLGCAMESSEGTLVVKLDDELACKTITPELDMDADLYRVTAERVGSSEVLGPVDITKETYTFNGILTGNWVVTVEAYNNDSPRVLIGSGSTTVAVIPGSITQTSVSVTPLSGNGTFTFTLDWTGNLIDTPILEAYLTPENASIPVAVDPGAISISASTATITVADLPTGYYDFSYALKNDEQAFAGNFHAVRILAGQDSSATEVVPVSSLGISVSIVNNLRNPFAVSLSSDDYVLECANTQTFIVAPADAAAYQWYLDGMVIAGANEASYELDGEGMSFGGHTLAVKVEQFDGSIASATTAFEVDPIFGRGGWVYLLFTNKDDPDETYSLWMHSGPAEGSAFDAYGTYPEYGIPINLELEIEKSPDDWQPGSFLVASSVPIDMDADLETFPMGGTMDDEHMMTIMGPWDEDFEQVVLDQPYTWCMLNSRFVDWTGFRKDFNAINNFHNPVIVDNPGDEPDVLEWGDLSALVGEGVTITFTKYGDTFGSYVKGTVSGSVVSVDYCIPEPILEVYSVTGDFVASKGIATVAM